MNTLQIPQDDLDLSAVSPVELELSVIVPIYNEVESLPQLVHRIETSLKATGKSFELLCVDDGSQDGSAQWLREAAETHPNLKAVLLRRNYGQTAAMAAGLDYAQGRAIVTLDADLQNPPEDIPKLLDLLEEGYDLVSGWRKERLKNDGWIRLFPSRIANWLIRRLTGVELHDYGCSLKAYRSEVIKDINLYGELHRFIPALAYIEGAKITEVKVKHDKRQFGHSKYGLGRTFRVVMDLFTVFFMKKFLTRPMHVFGMLGLFCLSAGMVIAAHLSYVRLILNEGIGDRPLLMFAVLLILTGVQLFCFGLLGELLMRTYHEAQGRPIYRVRQVVSSPKN